MVMSVVLVRLPRALWLGGVVASGREPIVGRGRRKKSGALLKEERHLALQADGVAGVDACRKDDGAAAGRGRCLDRCVDRRRINGASIAGGAEVAHVEVGPPRPCADSAVALRGGSR